MPQYAPNKGKKRCPICRGFFDKRGVDTHIKTCSKNHPMRAALLESAKRKPGVEGYLQKHPRSHKEHLAERKTKAKTKTKAKAKTKAPKEKFAVFGSIRDLDSYAIVGSLKDAQMLASELLEMETEADEIVVLRVVGEYKVKKVKSAELIPKK